MGKGLLQRYRQHWKPLSLPPDAARAEAVQQRDSHTGERPSFINGEPFGLFYISRVLMNIMDSLATSTLDDWSRCWENDNDYNSWFHATATILTNQDSLLKSHRDWVEARDYGFGDRAFHHIWKLLVDQMPSNFSFLEIGVFRGQVLSLIALLAMHTNRKAQIYGLTPLTNYRDRCCTYPVSEYEKDIETIHSQFNLLPNYNLIVGASQERRMIDEASRRKYTIVYIDGGHDYETVVSDIVSYGALVEHRGYLVMDDSSNHLNIGNCWPGLEPVSRAVRNILEPDSTFKHLFACGHLRVFRRK